MEALTLWTDRCRATVRNEKRHCELRDARSGKSAISSLADPLADHGPEDFERHITAEDDGIVERLDIEALAEARPRLLAQPDDLGMADLVAACLAGPDEITIDLTFRGD